MSSSILRRGVVVLTTIVAVGGLTACGGDDGDGGSDDGQVSDEAAGSEETPPSESDDEESTEGADDGEGSSDDGGGIELSVDICEIGADAITPIVESPGMGEVEHNVFDDPMGRAVCEWDGPAAAKVIVTVSDYDDWEPADEQMSEIPAEELVLGDEGWIVPDPSFSTAAWRRDDISVRVEANTATDGVSAELAEAIDADLQAAGH